MADELSLIGSPNIEISFSSPVDIVTTMISCATSIHNVNSITRTKYIEIQAALQAYNSRLKNREKEFADNMLRQKENLDILYRFLEMSFDGVKNSSDEKAAYWRDVAIKVLHVIEQVNKDGPPIENVSLDL